jgi:hypothetical protein
MGHSRPASLAAGPIYSGTTPILRSYTVPNDAAAAAATTTFPRFLLILWFFCIPAFFTLLAIRSFSPAENMTLLCFVRTPWNRKAARLTKTQVLAASLLPAALAAPALESGAATLQKRKYVIHKGAANELHWPSVDRWVSFDEL